MAVVVPNEGGSRLEVIRANDANAAQIAEFIRLVWDSTATPQSVVAARTEGAKRNTAEPGVAPPTYIALQAGRVLGYVTSIPIRFWDGERDWAAYWIKGLMVHPEFRNGPIGYLLLKEATKEMPRTGALAVAPPARRLFEALGYSDLGAVPNWVRPVALHRVAARIDVATLGLARLPKWGAHAFRFTQAMGLAATAGWVAGAVLRASAAVLRLPAFAFEAGPLDPSTSAADLDALWVEVRGGFPAGVVRDSAYLIQRYGAEVGGSYQWLAVWKRGVLVGVAILRRPRAEGDPRLRGIRLAALADLLYAPADPGAGLALLGAVERAARSLGADAVLATSPVPALHRLLRRQCYVQISGNVHFLFRDVAGEKTGLEPALANWWLTRGDGAADEVF